MALEFMEGWDLYPDGAIATAQGLPWTGTGAAGVTTSAPRNGRASFETSQFNTFIRQMGNFTTDVAFGFAVRLSAFGGASSVNAQIGLVGASGDLNVGLSNNLGQIGLYRGNVLQADSGSNVLTVNTYAYIFVYYNRAAGSCQVYVNRALWINIASGLVDIGAVNSFSIALFQSGGGGRTTFYDDIFVWTDPTVAELNALVAAADFEIRYAMPSADDTPSQWTASVGVDKFAVVNEQPVDTADYIEAANVNDIQGFNYDDISVGAFQVYACEHYYYAQKTTAGAGNVQGSVEGGAGADNAMATDYIYYFDVYMDNPATGVDWTVGDLALLDGSFERTA